MTTTFVQLKVFHCNIDMFYIQEHITTDAQEDLSTEKCHIIKLSQKLFWLTINMDVTN